MFPFPDPQAFHSVFFTKFKNPILPAQKYRPATTKTPPHLHFSKVRKNPPHFFQPLEKMNIQQTDQTAMLIL